MTGNLTIHFFICHLFRNLLFFLTHQLEKEKKHNENLDSLKLLWYNSSVTWNGFISYFDLYNKLPYSQYGSL